MADGNLRVRQKEDSFSIQTPGLAGRKNHPLTHKLSKPDIYSFTEFHISLLSLQANGRFFFLSSLLIQSGISLIFKARTNTFGVGEKDGMGG